MAAAVGTWTVSESGWRRVNWLEKQSQPTVAAWLDDYLQGLGAPGAISRGWGDGSRCEGVAFMGDTNMEAAEAWNTEHQKCGVIEGNCLQLVVM